MLQAYHKPRVFFHFWSQRLKRCGPFFKFLALGFDQTTHPGPTATTISKCLRSSSIHVFGGHPACPHFVFKVIADVNQHKYNKRASTQV